MCFLEGLEEALALVLCFLLPFLSGDRQVLGLLGVDRLLFGQFHRVLQVPQGPGRPAQALGEPVFALQSRFALIAVVAGVVSGPSGLFEVGRRLGSYDEGQLGFSSAER